MTKSDTTALLWSEDDVATALGVTTVDVAKLVKDGELQPLRILDSPTLRFRPADVADLVDRLAEPVTGPKATSPTGPAAARSAEMNLRIRNGGRSR